jgi:hypothetical protein
MLIIFFDSPRRSAQKIHTRGKKKVNAEFYTGVMDHLKRIQQVRPAAFCSQDFFLLHNNAPAHKATNVCQFLNQKNITTLYYPLYSPDLFPPDNFLFSKMKMKLKVLHFADVAEMKEAITDELKKIQKEEFMAVFTNCKTVQKPVYMPMRLILNLKQRYTYVFFFISLQFKKKSVLKIWAELSMSNYYSANSYTSRSQ